MLRMHSAECIRSKQSLGVALCLLGVKLHNLLGGALTPTIRDHRSQTRLIGG